MEKEAPVNLGHLASIVRPLLGLGDQGVIPHPLPIELVALPPLPPLRGPPEYVCPMVCMGCASQTVCGPLSIYASQGWGQGTGRAHVLGTGLGLASYLMEANRTRNVAVTMHGKCCTQGLGHFPTHTLLWQSSAYVPVGEFPSPRLCPA